MQKSKRKISSHFELRQHLKLGEKMQLVAFSKQKNAIKKINLEIVEEIQDSERQDDSVSVPSSHSFKKSSSSSSYHR